MDKQTLEVLKIVDEDSSNVAARVADRLNISRQAASSRLALLKKQGLIESEGAGRGTQYTLRKLRDVIVSYDREGLSEDLVWRRQCVGFLADLPENVRSIWHHGITEMVNNAIDHSGASQVTVRLIENAIQTKCKVYDDGEGIFLKIQRALDLYDQREALLELSKGKLTTDPANHSGEGIFFSSKMFDVFMIESDELTFVHLGGDTPDVLLSGDSPLKGTRVSMILENDSVRTTQEVFDQFALPDEFNFAKTLVPVKLAQHEGEKLVSRSQAKRLTRRFERFQIVMLDFEGVEEIGQAFADEVFRVFANAHPEVRMIPNNTSAAVRKMINRVTAEGYVQPI